MIGSIKEDIKRAWSRPNNGLIQLIIINAVVFVFLALFLVITKIFGADGLFEMVYKQFTLPGHKEVFLTRPWPIITYAITHSLVNFFHILMNMLVLYWFGRVFVEFFGSL
jgi:membrane associated rhomboid family serine protease